MSGSLQPTLDNWYFSVIAALIVATIPLKGTNKDLEIQQKEQDL